MPLKTPHAVQKNLRQVGVHHVDAGFENGDINPSEIGRGGALVHVNPAGPETQRTVDQGRDAGADFIDRHSITGVGAECEIVRAVVQP